MRPNHSLGASGGAAAHSPKRSPSRRDFMTALAVTPCLPRGEVGDAPACTMLATGVASEMPYYPQDLHRPAAPYSAAFEIWRPFADKEWYVGTPTIRWRRRSDGSTRGVWSVPFLFGAVAIDAHEISDLRDGKMRGFFAVGGGLERTLKFFRLLPPREALVANGGVIEETPIRSWSGDDGDSPNGRMVPFGNVLEWRVDQLQPGHWSRTNLKIDGASWPVKKTVLTTPEGGLVPGELHVWISEDLGVVLREETHSRGELNYRYRAVSLERGEVPEAAFELPSV